MIVLDEAAAQNPRAWWWLKTNGCDVNKGWKSQWSGRVDLPDGSLKEQYDSVLEEWMETVGLHKDSMVQDLTWVVEEVNKDLEFCN